LLLPAVPCRISDGLGFGPNARAALITRGLSEITRLAVAKGANPLTMLGLAVRLMAASLQISSKLPWTCDGANRFSAEQACAEGNICCAACSKCASLTRACFVAIFAGHRRLGADMHG